jgi:stalled ribosome rescue protein Dom34
MSQIGIWIDHQKAVIVSLSGDAANAKTVASDVGPHTHYAGSQVSGGEKKYEARHDQDLTRFYDEVIDQLGQPAAVLIIGPGEAKLQLKERLGRSSAFSKIPVGVETADRLTDPQVIAAVKEYFGG